MERELELEREQERELELEREQEREREQELGQERERELEQELEREQEQELMNLAELLKELVNEDWENYAHGKTGALVFYSYIEQIEELCKKKMERDVMSAFIKFLGEQ